MVSVLDRGLAQPEPARRDSGARDPSADQAPVPTHLPCRQHETPADRDGPRDAASLIELYQSVAATLASHGDWRHAYEHLRYALELATADKTQPPQVPRQVRLEVERLRREHAEAREQSIRDALTASYNRRYLDQRLVEIVEQSWAHTGGLAVALVDLDWFKSVNDTFGHLVGDRVLQQVVELLQVGLPEGGFCARYGGEEFVLMLPGVDCTAAITVAEAARERVERYPWSKIVLGLRVTVSIGVAHQPATGANAPASPEQQLRSADGLLYTAKQSGRNAVAYRVGGEVRLSGAPVRRPR